jgi:hypothetical protein
MATQDYAMFTSLLSIVIAIGALLWNIWQKFIFVKPKLQISFGIWHVMEHTTADVATRSGYRLLVFTVTNMGPGVVVLYACIGKPKAHWWTRRRLLGTINPIHNDPTDPNPTSIGPFSAGLPTKIDAGDVKSFYFPYAKDCFLFEGLARVGINDTYHRNTWCRGRDMRKVNRAYRRDFGH